MWPSSCRVSSAYRIPASRRGRRVVREAQVDRDAIGGLEPDALDLPGDAVGLRQQHLLRLSAVPGDQLDALRGRDPVGLQEDVDFAQGALAVPRALDRGGALGSDARHAPKPRRFVAEHAEGVGAERVDDLVRIDPPDARHQPAAEIAADAVDRGGQLGGERLDPKLVAMLAVMHPAAANLERLAALHAGQRADDHDLRVRVLAPELSDRVGILLVEKDDAFEHAGEAGGGVGHRDY